MIAKTPKRPRDANQLAHMIVGIATGDVQSGDADSETNAQMLGRKGGEARAKAITSERRSEIAKLAAAKRWSSKQER